MRALNIMCDKEDLGAFFCLYRETKFNTTFRPMFKACCRFLSKSRQTWHMSSEKRTSNNKCMVYSFAHSCISCKFFNLHKNPITNTLSLHTHCNITSRILLPTQLHQNIPNTFQAHVYILFIGTLVFLKIEFCEKKLKPISKLPKLKVYLSRGFYVIDKHTSQYAFLRCSTAGFGRQSLLFACSAKSVHLCTV